jgi:hypothetical protein
VSDEVFSNSVSDFASFVSFLKRLPAPGMSAEDFLDACESYGESFDAWLKDHHPDRSTSGVDWRVVAMLLEGATIRD